MNQSIKCKEEKENKQTNKLDFVVLGVDKSRQTEHNSIHIQISQIQTIINLLLSLPMLPIDDNDEVDVVSVALSAQIRSINTTCIFFKKDKTINYFSLTSMFD